MNNNSILWTAFFVIGNIIGSGFFMMPGILAPIGVNMLFSWMIASAVAIILGYIFGQLYLIFPKSNVISDYFDDPILKKTIASIYWVSCIIGNTGLIVIVIASLNWKSNPFLKGLSVHASHDSSGLAESLRERY